MSGASSSSTSPPRPPRPQQPILTSKGPRLVPVGGGGTADAGDACRLAAADSLFDIPSAERHSTCVPDVPLRTPREGYEALLSPARARAVIGFRPQVSWRDK